MPVFSPGISLTTQTWFSFRSFYQLKTVNQVKKVLKAEATYFNLIIISHTSLFLKKKKSSLCNQSYSWNKGGFKLFLFEEHRPMSFVLSTNCNQFTYAVVIPKKRDPLLHLLCNTGERYITWNWPVLRVQFYTKNIN